MADAQVTLRTRKFIRNPCSPSTDAAAADRQSIMPWKRGRGGPSHLHDIQHCAAMCERISDMKRIFTTRISDVLHPNRPNVSKDELRQKLSELYKADKDQVSVFGFRTQYGGGKSTGFALIYDSNEAMKKFEPHYRLVRVGMATKIEKASRQQRKQRKNRMKTLTGTAKVKGAKTKKDK
ncbi:unnamed protein product [Aureobasidium pullulans]|nr:unnamed protein product [Aureobasidium pullulans]